MNGKEEGLGYLLVAHTLGYTGNNCLLPLAQGILPVVLTLCILLLLPECRTLLTKLLLHNLHGRHEKVVLNQAMRGQILLTGNDFHQRSIQEIVVLLMTTANDNVLQLFQLIRNRRMLSGQTPRLCSPVSNAR